ncbi:MAG: hypothetical protein AB7O65_10405 [Candidatus Korobacteraceae bacterium]
MACSICEVRKEKRFCPAVHGRICSQCCGEQREVTLDCPSDCPYLMQARQHERTRSAEELDPAQSFPQINIPAAFLYEREPLIVGLTFGIVKSARADRTINDREILGALASLAKTYETRVNSGLVYEPAIASLGQQSIVAELQVLVAEYRKLEEQHLGYQKLRDSDVLRALVFVLRLGLMRTSGRPKSRSLLDFLAAQFPEKQGVVAPDTAGSRIVVP